MILWKLWQAGQMFDISWKFHLKYSVTITVPGMEERPSEFFWEKQLNIAGVQLMSVPIHCGHFPFIFFPGTVLGKI